MVSWRPTSSSRPPSLRLTLRPKLTENPFVSEFLKGQEVSITLALIAVLGVIFLMGFREAIGVAVSVVGSYLLLNAIVVVVGRYERVVNPQRVVDWKDALLTSHGDPLATVGVSLVVFPQLALGLSSFETGVTMMLLVRGDEDTQEHFAGRIRNTGKLLAAAALIMSFFLITTSFITTVLIAPEKVLIREGDTAPVIHEVLREAEPDFERHPAIHVGGR